MTFFKHVLHHIILLVVNIFFSGTHFWRIKRILLLCCGAKIGKGTKIVGPLYFNSKLTIGKDCWIGRNLEINGNGEVIIGDNCDFGPNVTLLTGSHLIGDSSRRAGANKTLTIKIGSGVWVGARVTVLGNSIIGDGCVVGCCSLINKNVPDNILVAGVPAKTIRFLD